MDKKKGNTECFLPKEQIKILSGLSLGFRCFFRNKQRVTTDSSEKTKKSVLRLYYEDSFPTVL